MKKTFLAALFMSCFAFALAAIALFLIYTSTAEEVQSLCGQQQHINQLIDKARLKLAQSPDDKSLVLDLEKLNMERVLLPLPWALEIEMVENGPISFILSVFGSAEARKEKLRNLILDQAAKTDLEGCPEEFRRLFRIYASPTGFGSESLQNLRNFAEKHGGSDEFGPPDVTQSE
ncbi:MAG: hypothetical protein GQF41_1644 [Candidatus Rifleibacterium amylolyticum]|nr:MAG: hypothetical protein GQF41_1644 [Candidatus Rifleibacterium amylolyticum]